MDLNESIRMDYTKWNFIIGIELYSIKQQNWAVASVWNYALPCRHDIITTLAALAALAAHKNTIDGNS